MVRVYLTSQPEGSPFDNELQNFLSKSFGIFFWQILDKFGFFTFNSSFRTKVLLKPRIHELRWQLIMNLMDFSQLLRSYNHFLNTFLNGKIW